MELMDDETEEAIRLLTRLAHGDVALVRAALMRPELDGVDEVIDYIKSHRGDAREALSRH